MTTAEQKEFFLKAMNNAALAFANNEIQLGDTVTAKGNITNNNERIAMTNTITVTLTNNEIQDLRLFLKRDFGITRNLTQYPVTTALIKIQKQLEKKAD